MIFQPGGTCSASSSDNHIVTAVNSDRTANLLRAKREAGLEQLNIVDRALAALTTAAIMAANALELPTEETTSPVLPTRVTPRRVLSDEHRQALTEGRREARHFKDAAADLARETLDPTPGLTPASTATRLVKRQTPASRR